MTASEQAMRPVLLRPTALGIPSQLYAIPLVMAVLAALVALVANAFWLSVVTSAVALSLSAAGIAIAGTTGGANTVVNNMITGVLSAATSPDIVPRTSGAARRLTV